MHLLCDKNIAHALSSAWHSSSLGYVLVSTRHLRKSHLGVMWPLTASLVNRVAQLKMSLNEEKHLSIVCKLEGTQLSVGFKKGRSILDGL